MIKNRVKKVQRLSVLVSFIFFTLFALILFPVRAQDIPNIAAAANIKFALDDIAKSFTQTTGKKVRISYGSSGNFIAQIKHGAPFELFLSADSRYINQLKQSGLIADDGQLYAIGKLALVKPRNAHWSLDVSFAGLTKALKNGDITRFAIANPEHAPYGERAQFVLQKMALWPLIEPKLIYGENVSQAAQFALSGSTQGGIVALSLALSPQFKSRAQYVELPFELYAPLEQRMVLLPHAGATANAFYHYIQSPQARNIFKHYGFGLPTNNHYG